MAQTPSGVRRGPALLTGLATVVVALGVLGALGVLEPPDPAHASVAATGPVTAAETSVTDPSASGGSTQQGTGPIATLGQRLATATDSLVTIANEPAADSSTPAPVDPTQVLAPLTPATDAVPAESGAGRRAVYSVSAQRVWLVEADERVNASYAVSGRLDAPALGSYAVYAMSPTAVSADGTLRMEHLVRFAPADGAAIGFHDIPVRVSDGTAVQTETQLGEPLSGGSIRQSEADAQFLFAWVVLGTTVVVVA